MFGFLFWVFFIGIVVAGLQDDENQIFSRYSVFGVSGYRSWICVARFVRAFGHV